MSNKVSMRQVWPYSNKAMGFNIPTYTSMEMKYNGNNLTTVYYKNNGKLVYCIDLRYDASDNLISASERNLKYNPEEVIWEAPQDMPDSLIEAVENEPSVPIEVADINTEEEYDSATTSQKQTLWSWFINLIK